MSSLAYFQNMPNDEFMELVSHEAQKELARRHLQDFSVYNNPDYVISPFTNSLCTVADKWAEQKDPMFKRIMVFAHPQCGKSTCIGQYLPAKVLGNDPSAGFMCASYGQGLANRNSRKVRGIVNQNSYQELFDTRIDPSHGEVQ